MLIGLSAYRSHEENISKLSTQNGNFNLSGIYVDFLILQATRELHIVFKVTQS